MIGRAAISIGLVVSVVATSVAAHAQPGRVPRIGILLATSPSAASICVDPFRQALREHGYAEGQSIVIENRWAEGRQERFAALARELVELKVDVIVATVSAAAVAARAATATIPVVMLVVGDPVRLGLVTSLARPGGNLTGLTSVGDELFTKQVQLLKEAIPSVSRVAVLWNPSNPGHEPRLKSIEIAARSLKMQARTLPVGAPEQLDGAFASMTTARTDALLVVADAMFVLHRGRIAELAMKARLPAIYGNVEHAEDGGLMAYAASYDDLCRRGAGYVDRILKGAQPAHLPVAQPTKFDLVLNLKTAQALGLTMPPSLLLRADRLVE
jgi:putative tryptophan/tyrosine transport system substrate-binding protein